MIKPGGVLDVSALSSGYSFSGGVLTAGRTGPAATDINGTFNVNNATLNVAGGSVGTLTVSNGSLGLSNATLNYAAGDLIAVAGALTFTNTDYIDPTAALSGGTDNLFTYGSGSPNLSALAVGGNNVSGRASFTFAASSGTVTLAVTSGIPANLQWSGSGSNVWYTGNNSVKNWYNIGALAPDYFYAADNVTFNDTPGNVTSISLSGTVVPGSVTVSNTNANYIFNGPGSIGGATSLTKNGPGSLAINMANTYTGGTTVNGGQLTAGAVGALGSGTLGVNGGTLTLNLGQPSVSSASLSGGLIVVNNASGLGSGTLTISGGSLDNQSGGLLTLNGNPQAWSGSFGFLGTYPLNMGAGAVALSNSPTVTVGSGTLTVGGAISAPRPDQEWRGHPGLVRRTPTRAIR